MAHTAFLHALQNRPSRGFCENRFARTTFSARSRANAAPPYGANSSKLISADRLSAIFRTFSTGGDARAIAF
jgi:hypothetical protein